MKLFVKKLRTSLEKQQIPFGKPYNAEYKPYNAE